MYYYIVIDDEELTRKGTIAKLRDCSSYITCIGEANDGQEALNMMDRLNPDIIITDMNMPNMDGSALLPVLAENYPQKPIIVISGYKDFEYTKNAIKARAIDYLLKPFGKEDIQKSIQDAIAVLNKKVLIQSQLTNSELEKERACYELDIESLKNTILGLRAEKISFSSKKLSHMNHTYQLILLTIHSREFLNEEHIKNYLSENGFGDLALYLQHNHNKHLGFMILFVPRQSVLTPESLCQQAAERILCFFAAANILVSIGISRIHNELIHLNKAFSETVHALNTKIITDLSQYYFFERIPTCHAHFKWEKEEELFFRIEAGMISEVRSLVKELFQYLEGVSIICYSDIKFYCFQLADQARTILTNYTDQLSPFSVSSSTQNILNSMFDLREIESYYQQFFSNLALLMQKEDIYNTDDVIMKAKIYMEKNYYKSLTVDLLSCFMNLSRSYFSSLFKERTGENFVGYLNSLRIEQAKLLLSTTDKKMYQIAKSIGYSNVKYFFRIFKKIVGVTPEQWKKTHSVI